MSAQTCVEYVVSRGYTRARVCGKRGVEERAGRWYCRRHDPEAVKAKREAWEAKWRAKRDASEVIRREGDALAQRLGEGTTYFDGRGPFSAHCYRRCLVVPFDVVDALLRELSR